MVTAEFFADIANDNRPPEADKREMLLVLSLSA